MSIAALLTALKERLETAPTGVDAGIDMRGFNVALAPGRFDAYELTRESFRSRPSRWCNFPDGLRS